MMCIKNI